MNYFGAGICERIRHRLIFIPRLKNYHTIFKDICYFCKEVQTTSKA